jgi:hypothetical protein
VIRRAALILAVLCSKASRGVRDQLANKCDSQRVGAHAVARNTAGGVGGAASGRGTAA